MGFNGKRQHLRTDGQCKQRGGNSKKSQKERLEIKNTLTEVKNAFDGLISRLDMERISELKNMTVNTSKTEKQRENKQKKQTIQEL